MDKLNTDIKRFSFARKTEESCLELLCLIDDIELHSFIYAELTDSETQRMFEQGSREYNIMLDMTKKCFVIQQRIARDIIDEIFSNPDIFKPLSFDVKRLINKAILKQLHVYDLIKLTKRIIVELKVEE